MAALTSHCWVLLEAHLLIHSFDTPTPHQSFLWASASLTCLFSSHMLTNPLPPPPFSFQSWGRRQPVRGVDNLLLTLSFNKACACCHGDSGGQREMWGTACRTDREGAGGTAGLTDCAPTPFRWASQSLASLTTCLAPPGINGGV